MKKKTVKLSILLFVLLYLLSYIGSTLNGYYAPAALGLRQDEDGNLFLAPKFGYRWYPFRGWDSKNPWFPDFLRSFYYPLVKLDLTWWHTGDDVESFNHPVRSFFDSSDNTLRDVN